MKNQRVLVVFAALFCCLMLLGVKSEVAGSGEIAEQESAVKPEAAKEEKIVNPEAGTTTEAKTTAEEVTVKELGNSASGEDIFFEKKNQVIRDGEPSPETGLKVWIKGDRIRFESEDKKDTFTIIMMDKGKSYELDKAQKTYKETSYDVNKLKEISAKSMVISKLTGEKKKIKDWNCYGVVLDATIQGNKTRAECWLSKDIHISTKVLQKMAKFSQMKMMEELIKYPGYPVQLVMDSSAQGKQIRIVSTLTKIEKTPIKADFFQIPFEYTKVAQ